MKQGFSGYLKITFLTIIGAFALSGRITITLFRQLY